MDLKDELINRAENEILAAQALKKISDEISIKENFNFPTNASFYSNVISHSYYAIFYSAKAYLLSKGFEIVVQGQHQQVYLKFRKLAQERIIDNDLMKIYKDIKEKADSLLGIFESERNKRSNFTYTTIPQANKQPAEDSLNNALFFVSHMKSFIKKKR